jgi:hypothetical protein
MAGVTVVLADRDLRALEQIAKSEGSTVQDLVQRAIHDLVVSHTPPDSEWRDRFERVLAELRSGIPPGIAAEEIEADVTAVREEVREGRRARRG